MRDIGAGPFMMVDRHYFERLGNHALADTYRTILRRLLPTEWPTVLSDIWLVATCPNTTLPGQGFKIHVSATTGCAEEVLRRVIPECIAARTTFKIAADPFVLRYLNSKRCPRGNSGKFMTVYPTEISLFKELLDRLHARTCEFEGPYILSDRRYKDSKSVYYRYGGFRSTVTLNADGTRQAIITAPDGREVADERLPYFTLPDWVSDPFPLAAAETRDDIATQLGGRFEIHEALSFSNAGGVYKGTDTATGRAVVVKEARPHVCTFANEAHQLEATALLAKEYEMLGLLREVPCVVNPIDLFHEWEHLFLAEDYVTGVPFSSYRAYDDVVLITHLHRRDPKRVKDFCAKFRQIAESLISTVDSVHRCGVVLGDISPGNVLINRETLAITLIDVESAYVLNDPDVAGTAAKYLATPGFRAPDAWMQLPTFREDYYAVGMVLYSLVLPCQPFFDLRSSATGTILNRLVALGLPSDIEAVVSSLLKGDGAMARRKAARIGRSSASPRSRKLTHKETAFPAPEVLLSLTRSIADYILSTTDTKHSNRLWPADYMLFVTNPLSIAYGACGTALFLNEILGGLPSEIEIWFQERTRELGAYPPGLYTGLAGLAYTFAEIGQMEVAVGALKSAYSSSLMLADSTVFQGAAGIGLVSLDFYQRTSEQEYLERACRIGEHLLSEARPSPDGRYWETPFSDRIALGFAYGGSGIGLFLLNLFQATGQPEYLRCAEEAMRFEMVRASEERRMRFRSYVGEDATRPYWLTGGAGFGSAAIRFYSALGDDKYLRMASRTAEAAFSAIMISPEQFQGMSGIGELLLDMFAATGRQLYRRRALELAASIMCYRIDSERGTAFTGRQMGRISTDYGTGSAGVGLFLRRLVRPGPRKLHDFWNGTKCSALSLKTIFDETRLTPSGP